MSAVTPAVKQHGKWCLSVQQQLVMTGKQQRRHLF